MPAPKGNKHAKGNKGGGRPTSFRKEYVDQAKKIAYLGATDVEVASIFGVSEATIHAWKRVHVEFSQALKEGKADADAKVVKSLHRRALGYSHKAVKIFADVKSGAEQIVPYIERYPPDTTAAIFWLKNRRPDLWRDKHEHEFTDVSKLSDDELEKRRKALGLA